MNVKDVVEKVRNANEVSITDLSNCCKWKQSNGGMYAFTVTFQRIDCDKWKVLHYTTAEFSYCKAFGEFRDCWDCEYYDDERNECKAVFETVTTEQVIEAVKRAMENEFKEVDIDRETVKYGEYGCEQCRKGLH